MNVSRKFPQSRLRRTRFTASIRSLVAENSLSVDDLIQPIFVKEDLDGIESIDSLPGVNRHGLNALDEEIEKIQINKIKAVAVFPVINPNKKDDQGSESLNEENLVCTAIKQIKKNSELAVIADVALDPYTSHGHDGLIKSNKILNDETIEVLINQSLLQAEMGCDILAPSDMMDGRIGKIRKALDKSNYQNVQILSYAAKYASSFYGPFRDAVGSKGSLKGDKKTYQMDFRNRDEALREVALDIKEGADMVMVKPGMPYLDIIKSVKEKVKIPVFAYQVSGEYSLISNAIQKKLVNEDIVLESLMSLKRAGANAIVSYYADRIDKILK